MKKVLLLLLSVPLFSVSFAQPKWYMNDSAYLAEGYTPVPFEMQMVEKWYCLVDGVIDNDSLLNELKQRCDSGLDTINLEYHILLSEYFGGDCHVRFRHYMYLDTAAKTMWWKVYNIYGGCRAGGGKRFLVKVPRPPAGYAIKIDEILVDRIHNNDVDRD